MTSSTTPLICSVVEDEITRRISASYDYEFAGSSFFVPPSMPELPDNFGIGLIVGPSGSGKSTLLKRFGPEQHPVWSETSAVASHFKDAQEAKDKLMAVGLNSIPAWLKPHHVLSNGEKFRADLARKLEDGAVVDEFTSVVDRTVAKACSAALRRFVDANGIRRVVLASCHYDIIDWLQPDWVFDTNTGRLTGRGVERRPSVKLEIVPCSVSAWAMFQRHHYLTGEINKGGHFWLGVFEDKPIAFGSALAFPNGNFKNGWREHRTVVLPDFQGLGIGVRFSDAIGQMFLDRGCRYFSKTSHPRMGSYRDASPLWRPTTKNQRARPDYKTTTTKTKEDNHKERHATRLCYSHEYIGPKQ